MRDKGIVGYLQQVPFNYISVMLMTNFWKAPKDEDWLPREPTKQSEDGTQPSCPHLQGGGEG